MSFTHDPDALTQRVLRPLPHSAHPFTVFVLTQTVSSSPATKLITMPRPTNFTLQTSVFPIVEQRDEAGRSAAHLVVFDLNRVVDMPIATARPRSATQW